MKALASTEKPGIAFLGGMKVRQTLDLIDYLLNKAIVDKVLTAGLVANFMLAAKGYKLGTTNIQFMKSKLRDYDNLMLVARKLFDNFSDRIVLPSDLCLNERGRRVNISLKELPAKSPIYDLGLDTIVYYTNLLKNARLIILNGPAGVFEIDEFALGTVEIFSAVAEAAGFSIFTGGYTRSVVERLNLIEKIDHVSTGSDASLCFFSGKPLPVIDALKHSKKLFEGGPYQKRT
jgi:phosphoglycerate kinase